MHSRRQILTAAVGASVGAAAISANADEPKRKLKGRVKQSIAFWCFNARGEKWDVDKMCTVAKELECPSVELISPDHWLQLKKNGLVCAMASNGMPGAPFV